jgi:hypothetical protein
MYERDEEKEETGQGMRKRQKACPVEFLEAF